MKNLRIEKIEGGPNEKGPWNDMTHPLTSRIMIPYKNSEGEYVWRMEGDSIDMSWPGEIAPEWTSDVVFFNGIWYWAAEE